MRIMTILGSPRRHGNTAKALTWVENQLRADGHHVTPVAMVDYNVKGCGECMACKRGTIELCSIGDDANTLFRQMVAADLVLFAAPIFCWGFPAQLKSLVDRMFCLMDFDGPRAGAPRLQGKPLALLLTAGGGEADNADLVIPGFEQLVQYLGARMAGRLFLSGCTEPDAMGEDVHGQVIQFAQAIARPAP
jgi:multimeric flavodoxin WrbA